MKIFAKSLCNLMREESGQDLIEYALVAGLIGIGAVVGLLSFSGTVSTAFNSAGTSLTSAT